MELFSELNSSNIDINGLQKTNLTKMDGDDDSPRFSPNIADFNNILSSLNH